MLSEMSGRLVVVITLLVTTAAACTSAPPVASLSWLPGDTVAIAGAPRAGVAPLRALREAAKALQGPGDKPLPECWDRVTKPIAASYQIWGEVAGDSGGVLVQGRVDRARAEACIEEVFRVLHSSLEISRDGELTRFDSPFGRANVGWTPEWVVWHPNRERIEALLAASRERGTISPVLAGAIARVDRKAMHWSADTRDDSGFVTGVPSRSWTLAVDRSEARVSFEYASPADAKRAVAAVAAASTDDALPPELRALAREARPKVVDRFVEAQVDAKVMASEETLGALAAWVEKKRLAR
jgi:hypothetical protein